MPFAQPADVEDIRSNVIIIKGLLSGIETLFETGDTLTTDGTEQNLYINNAPAGEHEPICVQIDFTNQTATETCVVRLYYRIRDGGGWIEDDEKEFAAAQDPALRDVALKPNRFGIRVTIEKTAGNNKDYEWGVHYKA